MYKVIKGTTSTIESELNKLSVKYRLSIESTGVIGDLIVLVLKLNKIPKSKSVEPPKTENTKEVDKTKAKNSGTKSTKSKS